MDVIRAKAAGARNRLRRAAGMLRGQDPTAPVRRALAATDQKLATAERTLAATERRLTAAERQLTAQARRLDELGARVGELQDDLTEQRGLGMRVAELSDVVAHLLAVAASGDRDAFERALAEYADGV